MKQLLDTGQRFIDAGHRLVKTTARSAANPPEQYDNKIGVGAWDAAMAAVIIPATVTLIEGVGHDVLGISVPHWGSTFGGTMVGCMLTVWLARRFKPQHFDDP